MLLTGQDLCINTEHIKNRSGPGWMKGFQSLLLGTMRNNDGDDDDDFITQK